MDRPFKPEATLMHSGRGRFDLPIEVSLHKHPSWQADFVVEGEGIVFGEDRKKKVLRAGDAVFIAPDARHGFIYRRPGFVFLTCWFALKSLPPIGCVSILKRSPASQGLIRALYELQPDEGRIPSRGDSSAIESCLEALISLFPAPGGMEWMEAPPNLAGKAMNWIQRSGGRRVTIKEMASAFNCSCSHLSHAFKEQFGRSLKEAIDAKRAEALERLSRQAGMSPAAMAECLGFRDSCELSRFCKRRLGSSPRKLRAEMRKAAS